MQIGIYQQSVERISLCYTAELGAVGRTQQFIQPSPRLHFLKQLLPLPFKRQKLFLIPIVEGKQSIDFGNAVIGLFL